MLEIRNRRITAKGLLRLLGDSGGELFHLTKREARAIMMGQTPYHSLDEYFPSVVERAVGTLTRNGWVEKQETQDGIVIKLTEKGKAKILRFKLKELLPKSGPWDGKWHMVFFDIEELKRKKRDLLRFYLKQLGLKQMQQSVWITPYNVSDEVKYLREIFDVPHSVKLGTLTEIENEEELKVWFELN